jgi:hypothetical protein
VFFVKKGLSIRIFCFLYVQTGLTDFPEKTKAGKRASGLPGRMAFVISLDFSIPFYQGKSGDSAKPIFGFTERL